MKSERSAAIAAAVILAATVLVFYFMPRIMTAAGEVSPWLAAAIGILAVIAFFALFWIRGRFGGRDQD